MLPFTLSFFALLTYFFIVRVDGIQKTLLHMENEMPKLPMSHRELLKKRFTLLPDGTTVSPDVASSYGIMLLLDIDSRDIYVCFHGLLQFT